MTTFFTSDLHFGHVNIIPYCNRPFVDVSEMTEKLITNWNETVTDMDEVFILGDACMGQRDKTVPMLGRLNGQLRLVPGNHDGCHPMFDKKHSYSSSAELYGSYVSVLGVQMEFPVLIDGVADTFRLCHFPYNEPGKVDYQGRDYSHWEPVDDGKVLLCGHVHDAWATKITPKGTPMINVGIDVHNYRPVAIEDLVTLANTLRKQAQA